MVFNPVVEFICDMTKSKCFEFQNSGMVPDLLQRSRFLSARAVDVRSMPRRATTASVVGGQRQAQREGARPVKSGRQRVKCGRDTQEDRPGSWYTACSAACRVVAVAGGSPVPRLRA